MKTIQIINKVIKDKSITLLFAFSFVFTSLTAQVSAVASGGDDSGNGGSVSYSIGQIFYTASTGDNGTLSEGVQQPYEIYVVTALEDAKDLLIQCSVHPNPASDYIILGIPGFSSSQQYTAILYSIAGTLLETIEIDSKETLISMQAYPRGIYMLKVTALQGFSAKGESGDFLSTIRIVKN